MDDGAFASSKKQLNVHENFGENQQSLENFSLYSGTILGRSSCNQKKTQEKKIVDGLKTRQVNIEDACYLPFQFRGSSSGVFQQNHFNYP